MSTVATLRLGTFGPYVRQPYTFTDADRWGANTAHHELIRAALERRHVGSVTFVVDQPFQSDLLHQETLRSLRQLRTAIGAERVLPLRLAEFGATAFDGVFLTGTFGLETIAQVRSGARTGLFPICSVVHQATSPQLLQHLFALLLLAESCDALVATSRAACSAVGEFLQQARELLSERGVGSVSTQPVRVERIPLGIEDELLTPLDRSVAREALRLPADALVVLYVGRLNDEYKADLDPLLLAAARVAQCCPSLLLVVAGHDRTAREASRLEAKAYAAGLGDRLRCVTNFPYVMKRWVYAAADIFVSPADNVQESFGLAILEAMASGLPVVASDWSGYRDLVVDGDTGFLVRTSIDACAVDEWTSLWPCSVTPYVEGQLARATIVDVDQLCAHLRRLALDAECRRRLGTRGRERVQREFTWGSVLPRLVNLWHEQVRESDRARQTEPRRRALRYGRALVPYAQRALDPHDLIGCTDVGRDALERGVYAVSEPPADLQGGVRRILATTASADARVNALATTSSARRSLLWLLKKGYCTVR